MGVDACIIIIGFLALSNKKCILNGKGLRFDCVAIHIWKKT